MSKTKAAGSTRLGRDSQPKYLGIKISGGQKVQPGTIIVRQRGTKYIPGKNVRQGKDDTLYAVVRGVAEFVTKKMRKFDGSRKISKIVNVRPQ